MQFSELTFEKVIAEVRYSSNYLFWDNSGKTMTQIVEKYPRFELRDAQVSNVQSDWWSEGIVLNFNYQKADLTQDFPKNLDNFKGVCGALCDAIRDVLQVKSFDRVGVRYIQSLPMKSADDARDFFSKMALVSVSTEKLQPFGKGRVEEQQALIRYEDDSRGYTFRLSHTPRDVKLKINRPFVVDTGKFEKNAVIFDVDCYTKKPVEAPAFIPAEFVRVTHRTVENSLLPLLGL